MVIVLSITANIYWVLKYFNLKTGQKHLQIFVVKHVLPSSGQNLQPNFRIVHIVISTSYLKPKLTGMLL